MFSPDAIWVVPVFTVLGTLIGAAISAMFGWFDGRRRIAQDKRRDQMALGEQQRLAMTGRTSELLAATYHAVGSMRDVALAPEDQKQAVEKTDIWPTVDRVNSCITAVKVNDPKDVVDAVVALDEALVQLSRSVRSKQWDMDGWRAERARVLGDVPDHVIAVVRKHAQDLQAG